jgi:hypothetical protein
MKAMSARKAIGIAAAIAGLALAGVRGTQVLGGRLGLGVPVYSLAQVEAGLRQRPGAWVGKAVRVRARLSVLAAPCALMYGGCGLAPASYYALDAGEAGGTHSPRSPLPPLVLEVGAEDPLYARLRDIPVLKNLVPDPPRLQVVGVTTVRLEPTSPRVACRVNLCYHALLLGPPPDERSP